uniref:CMRF35-like molecule 3 n=1 Tax=Podarcis muralis TaxID=64176 RepID=UPI00109F27E6|nr:CMRF35-like molecule 3 [Podarcis muralis]
MAEVWRLFQQLDSNTLWCPSSSTASFLGDFGYSPAPSGLNRENSRTMRVWRTMTLLIWGLLPGCMSVLIGPEALGGFLGKSLSVMCKYEYWYQTYKKYWCKGSSWNKCSVVVQTTGSEEEVKAGRMSIKDNHTNLEFTVRMESLTQQDAGIYWCGIKKRGYDPGFRIHITVLPASSPHPG